MVNEVIERAELFPAHLSNGRYVNGITFKFPIFTDGKHSKQWWYKQDTDESVCLLVKNNHLSVRFSFNQKKMNQKEKAPQY